MENAEQPSQVEASPQETAGMFFDKYIATLEGEIDPTEAARRVRLRTYMTENPGPWTEARLIEGGPRISVEFRQDDEKYIVSCNDRGHHRERYVSYAQLELDTPAK
jgi:hypothetical protein